MIRALLLIPVLWLAAGPHAAVLVQAPSLSCGIWVSTARVLRS